MSATRKRAGKASSEKANDDTLAEMRKAVSARASQYYVLQLYVTGATPSSSRAIARVRELCEEHLKGRYELEVIDIFQLPALARDERIIATPTLIKALPPPLRRYIGDLSKTENVLFGLDIRRNEK